MNKTLTNRLNNRNEKAPQGKAKIELETLRTILTNYLRKLTTCVMGS